MFLKKFRIRDFRSIVDSGWVTCQNITAFAGENESGKTSILMALLKLMNNKEGSVSFSSMKHNAGRLSNISLGADVPIDRADELMEGIESRVFIEAELIPNNAFNLHMKSLDPGYKAESVMVSKTYGGTYHLDILENFPKKQHKGIINAFMGYLPTFLYFQEMTEVSSRINFVSLAYKLKGHNKNKLTPKEVVYYNLLNFLDIWENTLIKSIEEVYGALAKIDETDVDFEVIGERIPMFKARFTRGFSILNNEFKKWWGNDDLNINYELNKKGILIKITDKNGKNYLMENRSTGFRRFFGLFLSFSVTAMKNSENAILLFDEAGAALHPLTQGKLGNYFAELGKTTQIIYNTHSAYMLPVPEMNRTRVVFKDKSDHTQVSSVLTINEERTNEMSLFALQSSLAFHLAQSALAGCLPIIVLNEEDRAYLSLSKNLLIARGKLNTVYETLIFSTGFNGIDAIAEMLGEGGSLPAVLLPSTKEGKQVRHRLAAGIYKNAPAKLLELSQLAPSAERFEDIMPAKFNEIFSRLYLRDILDEHFLYDKKKKLIDQIEEYASIKNITLPANYRPEMALRMKINTMQQYKNVRIPAKYLATWKRIWKVLLSL